jgi:hypothetical protein
MFLIDDEAHCEPQEGRFQTRTEAVAELERRAAIPWDEEPNRAPCRNWRTCGRRYAILEYDQDEEVSREPILAISAKGIVWQR